MVRGQGTCQYHTIRGLTVIDRGRQAGANSGISTLTQELLLVTLKNRDILPSSSEFSSVASFVIDKINSHSILVVRPARRRPAANDKQRRIYLGAVKNAAARHYVLETKGS